FVAHVADMAVDAENLLHDDQCAAWRDRRGGAPGPDSAGRRIEGDPLAHPILLGNDLDGTPDTACGAGRLYCARRECPAPGRLAPSPRETMPLQSPKSASPKVGFVSLGCPKTLVDSERILTQL